LDTVLDFDYSSDEDGDKDTLPKVRSRGDRFGCQYPPSSEILHAMICSPYALHVALSEDLMSVGDAPSAEVSSTSSLLISAFIAEINPKAPGGAIVSVECVAALVEHIFEDSHGGIEESRDEESSALLRLEKRMQKLLVLLENVWSSAITPHTLENWHVQSNPSVEGYESLVVLLDEDAMHTTCTTVFNALQVLILDSSSRLEFCTKDSSTIIPHEDEIADSKYNKYLQLGSAALSCVSSLLKNESTFRAWAHAGGMKSLVLLARQSPPLPPALHSQCLHLIAKSVRRYSAAVALLTPPAVFETSGYQDLLELARSSVAIDAKVATPLRDALNWLYLAQTCFDLRVAGRDSEGGLASLALVASALTAYLAAVNATETAHTMVVDANTHNALLETQSAATKSLYDACSQLKSVYQTVTSKSAALRAAIAVCCNFNSLQTNDDSTSVDIMAHAVTEAEIQADIALILTETDVCASFILLAALTQTADEYINAVTWDAPHWEELVSIARGSRAALASTAAAIIASCGANSAAVFAAKPSAVQLIWQFTAAEEHVLMTESPNELIMLAKDTLATNGAGTIARNCSLPASFRPASIGWCLKLLVLTSQAVEEILQSKWGKSTAMLQHGNSQSTPRSLHFASSDCLHALQRLSEICSFPAGAAVATRVIIPLLLKTILDISQDITCVRDNKRSFVSDLPTFSIDLQVLVLCLELVHHCLLTDDVDSVTELVRPCQMTTNLTLLAYASASISSISSAIVSLPSVETKNSHVWCCKILKILSINGDALINIESSVNALSKVAYAASTLINESNLCALALSMHIISSQGKYVFAESMPGQASADPLSTTLQAAVNVLYFTMSLVQKGATWAVDPAVSTVGYTFRDLGLGDDANRSPESPFPVFLTVSESGDCNPLSQPIHSKSLCSSISQAEVVHHALLSALQLIEVCLTVARIGGATTGPASILLVDALCEANAHAFAVGLDRTGAPGCVARLVTSLSTKILLHYCPPSDWSTANPGLIPYLLDRGSKVPRLRASNMELVTALMSMSIVRSMDRASASTSSGALSAIGGRQATESAAHWQSLSFLGEDVENLASTNSDVSSSGITPRSQQENMNCAFILGSGSSEGRGRIRLHRWSRDNGERCCLIWSHLIDSIPFRIGRKVVPFLSAYTSLNAQSAGIRVKKGDDNIPNAQQIPIYKHRYSSNDFKPSCADPESGNIMSDPWYYLRQYTSTCSHTPMALILQALSSCSIPSHNAAYRLCRGVMALSPRAAHQLALPLLGALQNISLFLLKYSSRTLTRVTDHSNAVMEGLREPLTLVHTSNDACRYLLLLESLCAQDCCCLMLCSSGLIHVALSCLHCLRQEVVVLALQVLTTTYRSLMRLTRNLDSRLAAQHANAAATISSNNMNESAGHAQDASDFDGELAHLGQLFSDITSLSKALADALVEILPSVASRFQAPLAPVSSGMADSPLVLLQIAFLLPLLSYQHSKALLDNLALGMTVEVFCIKLWLHVEESMQGLVEASEVVKALLADSAGSPDAPPLGVLPSSTEASVVLGDDAGRSYVRCALAQAATSVVALRHALELAILAYTRGWISLIVLQRTMRSTLVDPKHLITAYQRVYMILANDRATVEATRTMWILRKSSNGAPHDATSISTSGTGSNKKSKRNEDDEEIADMDAGLHLPKLPGVQLRSPNESDCVRLDAIIDDEVRHAMIATSLAQIKDSVVTARQHFSLQVDRQVLADKFAGSATSGSEMDMQEPFGKLDYRPSSDFHDTAISTRALQAFYSSPGYTIECRLDQHTFCYSEDAYHRALRKPIIEGDDRRASIFNTTKPGTVSSSSNNAIANYYIRLKTLPRRVDPGGVDRRKSRRLVRQNEIDAQIALHSREKRKFVEMKAGTFNILSSRSMYSFIFVLILTFFNSLFSIFFLFQRKNAKNKRVLMLKKRSCLMELLRLILL